MLQQVQDLQAPAMCENACLRSIFLRMRALCLKTAERCSSAVHVSHRGLPGCTARRAETVAPVRL